MSKTTRKLYELFGIPILIVVVLWIIYLFDLLPTYRYGLQPRTWAHISGIFTAPFMHSNLGHLSSNSVPIFVLTSIILFFYRRVSIQSILLIYILTGLAVWLFARPANHIGASGVVYGLVSFVFWSGIFRRNLKSIILALVITIMYSGYFHGILPNQEGISWESHLFGGIVGIFTAFLLKDIREPGDEAPPPLEDESKEYFLPRDVFEKTKEQREWERRHGIPPDTDHISIG